MKLLPYLVTGSLALVLAFFLDAFSVAAGIAVGAYGGWWIGRAASYGGRK